MGGIGELREKRKKRRKDKTTTFRGVLETTVGDGTEKFRLQQQITEPGSVAGEMVIPVGRQEEERSVHVSRESSK